MELDVYIPECKVGIEYDGKIYHESEANKERDLKKYEITKRNGIQLIRIVNTEDSTVDERCDYCIRIISERKKELDVAIKALFKYLNIDVDVNVNRDRFEILHYLEELDISLVSEYPDIAKEFDVEKNNQLKPEFFHPDSNERVWWLCSNCGHSWLAQISMRTTDGNGCPKCAKKEGQKEKRNSI